MLFNKTLMIKAIKKIVALLRLMMTRIRKIKITNFSIKLQDHNLLMTESLTLIKDLEPSPKISEKEEAHKSISRYPSTKMLTLLCKSHPKNLTLDSFIWMLWHLEWELVVFKPHSPLSISNMPDGSMTNFLFFHLCF